MQTSLRTAKTQSGTTEKYTFDAIDQVTGVSYTGGTASTRSVNYNYDSVGNRTSVVDNGTTTSYETNNLNAYTSVGGSAVGSDLNGNLIAQQSSGLSALYFYDAQNRLVKSTVGSNVIDFDYDTKNRVVKRTLNGVPTFLIYDGWSLVEERDGSGNILARYVHGINTDEILTKADSTGAVYYHHDGLGSTTLLTDSVGKVIEKYSYDVFGKATISSQSNSLRTNSLFGNRFLFTGREFLKEVNLYDYRNRVYSCELGRFLQTDPIRFSAGDVNLYRYVGNRVVILIDPSGRFAHIIIGAAIGVVAGGVGAALTGGNVAAGALAGGVGGVIGAATGNVALGGAVAGAISSGIAAAEAGGSSTSIAVSSIIGAGVGAGTAGLVNSSMTNAGFGSVGTEIANSAAGFVSGAVADALATLSALLDPDHHASNGAGSGHGGGAVDKPDSHDKLYCEYFPEFCKQPCKIR